MYPYAPPPRPPPKRSNVTLWVVLAIAVVLFLGGVLVIGCVLFLSMARKTGDLPEPPADAAPTVSADGKIERFGAWADLRDLTLDDAHVYFADGKTRSVYSLDKASAQRTTLYELPEKSGPLRLFRDGSTLYVLAHHGEMPITTTTHWYIADLYRLPTQGGEPRLVLKGLTEPHCMAIDPGEAESARIYWLHEQKSHVDEASRKFRLNPPRPLQIGVASKSGTLLHKADDNDPSVRRLFSCATSDAKHVYYSAREKDSGAMGLLTENSDLHVYVVERGDVESGKTQPKRLGHGWCDHMALDETHIYCGGPNQLLRIAKDGSATQDLYKVETAIDKPEMMRGMSLSGAYVYFTMDTGKSLTAKVMRVPKAGGPVTVLANGFTRTGAVAADASHAYFTTANGVYRVKLD